MTNFDIFSKIDFDEGNLAAGTVITDQFENLSFSASSEFGVMLFDTNNPTGEDLDLSAENLGKVLIISEDGDSSDPDDSAAGGTITIKFERLTTITAIGLLDIEELGGSVSLFDDGSSLIEVIEIEPFANGRSLELNLNVRGVAWMEVNLAGSGALTELNFSQEETFMGATQLTEVGWEKNGRLLGMWTNDSDVVQNLVSGIEVADTITANTLKGDDLIYGMVSSGVGLLNQGTITTDNGKDFLLGRVTGSGDRNTGILNDLLGIINTGKGDDQITGTVKVNGNGDFNTGIFSDNEGSIDTGAGNDRITGIVKVKGNGDFNTGVEYRESSIIIGDDNDRMTGVVEVEGSGNSNSGISGAFVSIDMGAGNDEMTGIVKVEGNGDFNGGISISFFGINMGADEDKITSTVEVKGNGNGNSGIATGDGRIDTGDGNDQITSVVEVKGSGNNNSGVSMSESGIGTGNGNDQITSVVEVKGSGNNNTGIQSLFGGINMGTGDDEITSVVEVKGNGNNNTGIQSGFGSGIDMGAGNDRITGVVQVEGNGDKNFGILNVFGSINMGAGDDEITGAGADAFTGFGGSFTEDDDVGFIDLGEGNDKINGFGEQIVDGGTGMDTAEFEFNLDELITLSSSESNAIDITANEATMSFINVEKFMFVNGSLTLDELIDSI